MSLKPFHILGYDKGLETNKKAFLLGDSAFPDLYNAYVWRGRVKKREGIKLVARLRRYFTALALGNAVAGSWTINTIFSTLTVPLFVAPQSLETTAEIEPGSVRIVIGAVVLQDQGDGTLTSVTPGCSGVINYLTYVVTITHTAGAVPATIDFGYFPGLPCMGNTTLENSAINDESAVIFDTKYAYSYDGDNFSQFGTSQWTGSDSNFFWTTNYRGATADLRLFFATNFYFTPASLTLYDPIRYYDGSTWNDFAPFVNTTIKLIQARIILPYYGRLLALNTYEGTAPDTGAQYFNRCRFSQIGDPTNQTNDPLLGSWLENVFGKGGFIDAPTAEVITSARFFKNTLIVTFERSTWELIYVGEYGMPFKWERISSDFGSESTFSTVLFDDGVLAIGDKAIVASSGSSVSRIDVEIPDAVFSFNNRDGGKERIQVARDFKKQVVFWSFPSAGESSKYPNRVLVYDYDKDTWALFRDNVTAFGILQTPEGDSWDSSIQWDSATSWDEIYPEQYPAIISGNQQGFIHWYQTPMDAEVSADSTVPFIENESLSIRAITRSATSPLQIQVINHNLKHDEIIFITGMLFVDSATQLPITTDLNDKFYIVTPNTNDLLDLYVFDFETNHYKSTEGDTINFTPATGTGTYIGGGLVTLLPKMEIRTKDFNPFQGQGKEFAVSYIDMMVDATPRSAVTASLFVNSVRGQTENVVIVNDRSENSLNAYGRISAMTNATVCLVTSKNHGLLTGAQINIQNVVGMVGVPPIEANIRTVTFVDTDHFRIDLDTSAYTAYVSGGSWEQTDSNLYVAGSNYAWHRFYSPGHGQYLAVDISYSDALMNDPDTHKQAFEMNAMTVWGRAGGKNI